MASESNADLDDAVDGVEPDRSAVTDAAPRKPPRSTAVSVLTNRTSTDSENSPTNTPPSASASLPVRLRSVSTREPGRTPTAAATRISRPVSKPVRSTAWSSRGFPGSHDRSGTSPRASIASSTSTTLHCTSSTRVSTSTQTSAIPITRAFLSVAATFAELEAEIKRQNTMQGLTAAREQGKHTGRTPFGFNVGPEGHLSPRTSIPPS